MPVHDWTLVDAGIFHHLHQAWINTMAGSLNSGLLPPDYYALTDQVATGYVPDVVTLQADVSQESGTDEADQPGTGSGGVALAAPRLKPTATAEQACYRRKQNVLTIRHLSGDRGVALIEIISPGNKASRHAMRTFVDKAARFLERRIHLLIVDLHPPGPRDPQGIHGELWAEFTGEDYSHPADKPLTLAAYDSGDVLSAYVVPIAVGDVLNDMPLFLEPGLAVDLPLEATYTAAFSQVPRRWRRVLEPAD